MRAAVATLLVLAGAARGQERPAIEWSAGLDAAVARGARDQRPVLLYFTFET